VLAHFCHHVLPTLLVPLLPFIRDAFALDYTRAGFVVSAFTLSYGISQLPAGWLADRVGPRLLITVGVCGVALAGLLVGLSQTYIWMVVFLVLMGVMGGGYHPSAPPLISASVEPKKRGRALGIHLVGGSASHFLAPLIGVNVIAAAWGWRSSFIGLAVPTIVLGIVLYLLLGRRADPGLKRAEPGKTESHDETPLTPDRLLRLAVFLTLTTVTSAILFSTVAFIPLFMVDHLGVSEEVAAVFLALIYSAGLWAGPLGGYLSDRLGRVPVILAACFLAGSVIYLLNVVPYGPVIHLLNRGPYGLGLGAVLLILGMLMTMRMPVAEAYIVGQTPEHRRSTVLGIYYFGGMEGGGVLTPVMGFLIDRFGFYPSFTIASAAIVAVTLICSVFLWRSRD